MSITLDKRQLMDLISGAVQIGVETTLVQTGLLKPYLTQTTAYKMYGRKTVEKWIKEGRITAHKSGDRNSKVLLDRLALQALMKTDDLIVYFKQAA
jgi:excisionase family DNA binding protein